MSLLIAVILILVGTSTGEECLPGKLKNLKDKDCTSYLICDVSSGDYKIKFCPKLTRFDPLTSTCQPQYKVNCSRKDSKFDNSRSNNDNYLAEVEILTSGNCQEGTKRGIVGDCDSYFECQKGKEVRMNCPWLRRFNQLTHECNWIFNVDCSTCVDGQTKPAKECKNYYECQKGSFQLQSCQWYQGYDIDRQECINYIIAKCSECGAGDKRGVIGDCRKYQECLNGIYVDRTCPILHVYDETIKSCKWSLSNQCSNMKCHRAGQRLPYVSDCRSYLQCLDDYNYVIKKCRFGYYFDKTTTTCLPKDKAQCQKQNIPVN